MVASSLSGVDGLGPARRERLLGAFGSLDALRHATLDELEALAWLPGDVARRLYDHLRAPPSPSRPRGATMSEVLLVTGMSGAGRSTVSAALEDIGWFVIDNMPIELIARVGELAISGSREYAGVAFIVGRSGGVQPHDWLGVERELRRLHENAKILFLDAPDDVLIHRFEGNRRRHPFDAATLAESIKGERGPAAVDPRRRRPGDRHRLDQRQPTALAHRRDLHRDGRSGIACGSRSSPSATPTACRATSTWSSTVASCPTPTGWRSCGRSRGSMSRWPRTCSNRERPQHFLADVVSMLEWQIPEFQKEGKSYLSVAIGCTGGRHRSVAIAEELRRRLQPRTRRLPPRYRSMRVVAVGGGHGTAVSLRALQAGLGRRHRRGLGRRRRGIDRTPARDAQRGRRRRPAQVPRGALADPGNPLTASFEHRFSVGELNGHAVGNLLLVGLIDATGDLEESVRAVAQVMGVTGAIVPASAEGVVLVASTEEGDTRGQTAVMQSSTHPPDPRGADQRGHADRRRRGHRTRRRDPDRSGLALHQRPGGLRGARRHPGARRARRRRRSTSPTSTPRSPRPRGTRSRTTSTRWCATASYRTWCWSTSSRSSRRNSVHSPFTLPTSRDEMAWSTMCKN